MPRWLEEFPKWWQILGAMGVLLMGGFAGSAATARWLGWRDWGPSQRLAAIETRDSLQDLRISATRDSLHGEVVAMKDSLWIAIRELRDVQDASLRLQCAQTPELYQRLARVRCR